MSTRFPVNGGGFATDTEPAKISAADLPSSVPSVSSQSAMFPLRLTVGPTPPTSPSGNDLWLSTSWQDVRPADGPLDRRIILTPNGTTEGNIVQEACVYFDGTDWQMIYADASDSANWATCPGTSDPTGPNYTKYSGNPVILGGGIGPGAYYEASTVYIYYGGAGGDIYVKSGSDPAHLGSGTVAMANNQQGATSIQNPRIFKRGTNDYVMFFSSVGGGIAYSAGFGTASSPAGPFTVASGHFPLNTLKPASVTNTVDGPVVRNENGVYVGWYHADDNGSTPQEIFRATSADLVTWTILDGKFPVLKREQPQEVDQVADVFIAIAPDGFQFAVWEGFNNDLIGSSVSNASVIYAAPLAPVLKVWTGGAWRAIVPVSPSFYRKGLFGNEFFGMGALAAAVAGVGINNTAFGNRVMEKLTTASANTGIGDGALQNITDSAGSATNVAVGLGAMQQVAAAMACVAMGYHALLANNGNHNVAIGDSANTDSGLGFQFTVSLGDSTKANADGAVAVGYQAQATAKGAIAIGRDSAGTSASATNQDDAVIGTALTTLKGPGKLIVPSMRSLLATPTYGTSITPNLANGRWQSVIVTNGTAFTINAPSSSPSAAQTQELVVEIVNASGGAMGAITWANIYAFAGATWTNPANNKRRFARFEYNGVNWVCTNISSADYGAAPFNPATVTGLQFWLKADALALADGASVASWTDSSGNGHNATQGTPANQPVFKTGILNGRPVVRFAGASSQSLSLGNLSALFPTAGSVFVVATPTGGGSYNVYETVSGGNGFWYFSGDGTGYMEVLLGNRAASYPSPAPSSGTHIWSIESTSTTYRIWLDTVDQGSIATPGYAAGTAHVIGNGNAGFFTGDVAEILAYNSALGSTDRSNVEGYLQGKYGL